MTSRDEGPVRRAGPNHLALMEHIDRAPHTPLVADPGDDSSIGIDTAA